MSRYLILTVIVALGLTPLWGCGPSSVSSNNALETRIAKLERDMKALEGARDTALARADAAEKRTLEQSTRAKRAEQERDALQQTLAAKQKEGEALSAQFDSYKGKLRELLGQMDSVGLTLPTSPLMQTTSLRRE